MLKFILRWLFAALLALTFWTIMLGVHEATLRPANPFALVADRIQHAAE